MKKFLFIWSFFLIFCFLSTYTSAAQTSGWVYEDNNWYYSNENGEYQQGWKWIDNRWYYFEQSGKMLTGWLQDGEKWYHLSSTGAMDTGWISDRNKWYYLYANGEMATNWQYIDGKWNYLHSNGEMSTGWQYVGGKWYYLHTNGAMLTGWQQIGDRWYYLYSNGDMLTGWQFIGGKWYLLQQSGEMLTGWQYTGNKWYYLNASGEMVTGWQQLGGEWFYLHPNGDMATGWIQWQDKWYFLQINGVMKTGFLETGGHSYYLFHDGVMAENTNIGIDTTVPTLRTVGNSEQIILVTTKGYGVNSARIRAIEKVNGTWIQVFDVSGFIGKNGFALDKREGDGKTPRGAYSIGTAFGRISNPGTLLSYRGIVANDVWVDDPASSFYNTWQQAPSNQWNSAENMNIFAYDYGFVINYNTFERVAGKGSAIFFHVGTNATLGCTATEKGNVINFLHWLNPNKSPLIIQSPENELILY